MKKIEKDILVNISRKLQLKYGIMSFVLRKYTLTIYKIGYDDGFNFKSSHGCNTAVQVKYKCKDIKGGKLRESKDEKHKINHRI